MGEPYTRDGLSLMCPRKGCDQPSDQDLGLESVTMFGAYCQKHNPESIRQRDLERRRKLSERAAAEHSEWHVITCDTDHYNAPTYILAKPGFVLGSKRDGYAEGVCDCGDYDCDHLVAADAPYYNTAPSKEDAALIADAVNFYNEHKDKDHCW